MMEIFRKQGQHSDFYIERPERVSKHSNQQSDERKDKAKDEELEQRLLSITLHIVKSFQEFQSRASSPDYYLNRVQRLPYKNEDLGEAKELFFTLKSMEEKIAQLFFYAPTFESSWDEFVENIHRLQNHYGLGGVLCGFGAFDKQCSCIRLINQKEKTPLLLGSHLEHSLHFYIASRQISIIDYQDIFALGEDLGIFLKEHGIVFSLSLKEIVSIDLLNYSQFIQGLEHSGNIQGRMYDGELSFSQVSERNPIALRYSLANTIRGLSSNINFSILKFMGSSILANDKSIVKALSSCGEYFIFSNFYEYNIGLNKIIQLIRSGKISPELLNKSVMKILVLKHRGKELYN
ncbi:hypothetical protein [Chlamydia sp. 17-3921]|uniref:hypothetical protein n=1 Tax=Chlamydia sp. 17-3921 TaxID=2675798 RepID=UPI001F165158|nr:hypothetical protein [Chlamydia sp. 17-3921]